MKAEPKHYIDLFELAPIAYLSLGIDQIIREANFAAAALLRSNRERLPGANFGSFVAERSRPVLAAFLRQVSATGITQSCEIDLSRENQSAMSVMLTARPGSEAGECLVAMTDISSRRLAERTLRESEERYRTLFARAGDGILVLAHDGHVIAANESFGRMHGYGAEEILNISVKDLLAPGSLVLYSERMKRILAGEFMTFEVEHYHKDGHVFSLEASTSLIASGNEVYIQSLYRDITERKRTEAVLLAANRLADSANRAKTRFLAAASHDLRQPVQAINLFLDALAHTSLSDEQKEISRYLGMSARALRELLGTLLDISQLDAGVVKRNMAVMRPEDLFRELSAEFAHLAAGKNLSLRFFAGGYMALVADPNLLLRALRNLIGNAIKYTEHGGILVGARRRGARAFIQVWDTGIGVAPEHIGQIFEEYFQVDNRARDRTKGMGLGLSIVERLVKLIGGEISCRSRPGRGTLFEIGLPLVLGSAIGDTGPFAEAASDADALDVSRIGGRRIVVVEDDLLVAEGLEQAFGALGATVAAFRNAEEALASSATDAADLYITDFLLPGRLNGIQLLNAIQRRSANPINAVLMTGETSSEQLELSTSSNWKVLFKPVDLRTLLSAVWSCTLQGTGDGAGGGAPRSRTSAEPQSPLRHGVDRFGAAGNAEGAEYQGKVGLDRGIR